jgi:hypothetical protein
MTDQFDRDHIISQGTLRCGAFRVDYYTTTPAPDQWAAIGVICAPDQIAIPTVRNRMLVGRGSCERRAIANLQNVFARRLAQTQEYCEIATELIPGSATLLSGERPAR